MESFIIFSARSSDRQGGDWAGADSAWVADWCASAARRLNQAAKKSAKQSKLALEGLAGAALGRPRVVLDPSLYGT